MDMASSLAFINRGKPSGLNSDAFDSEEQIDTNVITLSFEKLKEAEKNIQMGDPIFCKQCNSSLNIHSMLTTLEAYKILHANYSKSENPNPDPLEEEKDTAPNSQSPKTKLISLEDLKSHNKVWICEFCDAHNIVSIEQEEIPSKEDIIYVKQSANQVNKHGQSDSDISIVFCIDNSGSMSITTEIEGKVDLRHGLSKEEYEMLKQFIEVGADQQLPGQKKNTTYVSRKQCVFAAIENQLQEMLKSNPKRKVGLVSFSNEVNIYGDGCSDAEVIAGDKLYKYDICMQTGITCYDKLLSTPISEAHEKFLQKFNKLEANGRTALGPALLASVGMASQGKEGSMVVICTDGLANIGLGELDTGDIAKAEKFYNDVGEYAKSKGIALSVLSIKGEGCKLEVLGKLADLTSGNLTRVDPKEITKDFANILKDEVIGTKVEIKIKLHKGFRFRNEQPERLSEGGSLCKKEVGNVTAKSELTFEYENKNDVELKQLGVDIDAMKEIPFQAIISYISSEGHHLLRVITKKQVATRDQVQAEKHAKINLLATRALQKQAELASKGDYARSEVLNKKWGTYMEKNVLQNQIGSRGSQEAYAKFSNKNEQIAKAVTNTKLRKERTNFTSVQIQSSNNLGSNEVQQQQSQASIKSTGENSSFLGKLSNFFSKKAQNDAPKASNVTNASRAQSQSMDVVAPSSMYLQPSNNNNNNNNFLFPQPSNSSNLNSMTFGNLNMQSSMQQQQQQQEPSSRSSLLSNLNQSPQSISFGAGNQESMKMGIQESDLAEEEDQDAELIFKFKNLK